MMPADFVGSLTPLVTKGVLTGAATAAATGVLGLAIRVTQPLALISTAFQTAYVPIYFSIRKEDTFAGSQRLALAAQNVWAAAVGFAVAAALLGPPLVIVATPETYHPAAPLVPIIALGFLASIAYNLLAQEIFFQKKTWLLPVIVYCSAAADIGISVLTAEKYGAVGVAWGSAVRLVLTALIAGVISCRLSRIPYAWFSMVRAIICGCLVVVPLLLLMPRNPLLAMAYGFAATVAYGALLWLSGDPSIRSIGEFAFRGLRKNRGQLAEQEL
jgi:O-antigen/teichoic acid export membrane protein